MLAIAAHAVFFQELFDPLGFGQTLIFLPPGLHAIDDFGAVFGRCGGR